MKKLLKDRIAEGDILLADGAWGTMFFERGLKQGECPELWNLTHPEIVSEIAALYLEAGSELISTNTFGASPMKLAGFGLEGKAAEINFAGVNILKNIVGKNAYILASCGPTGKILKPYGNTEPDSVYETFSAQMRCLVKAGADAILIETMTDLHEAVLAVTAAKAVSDSIPILATMTFDRTQRGFFTIMGVTVEKAARELQNAGADCIGSNCGNGIENMIEIALEFRKHTSLPLIIQPNAGLPEMKEERLLYKETPEFMAEKATKLIEADINILGGCCGTTPAHIAAFQKLLRKFRRKTKSPNANELSKNSVKRF